MFNVRWLVNQQSGRIGTCTHGLSVENQELIPNTQAVRFVVRTWLFEAERARIHRDLLRPPS